MFTTATSGGSIQPNFRTNRTLQILLTGYLLFWGAMAIRPIDPRDWFLENVLVAAFLALLWMTYRRFPFSDLSYVLIAAFLVIHAIGAHYTYALVPFGAWLQSTFHLMRNHFDRIAHGCFGLFLAYPFREAFLRLAHVRESWAYYLAVEVTLALSALYELFEAWVAQIANPALGNAYLGSQGDGWDAQNDMTAALAGAILCMAITAGVRRRRAAQGRCATDRSLTVAAP